MKIPLIPSIKKLIQCIITVFILTDCSEEKVTPREYPRVITSEVTNITSSGALLHGEITSSSVEILDYGFIWSEFENPTLSNSEKISLGSKSITGTYEGNVQGDLKEGVKYSVRAYAKSTKFLVYGNIV